MGRFLSRDPIGFAGGLNLFSYGGNNPVTYTDHTGLLQQRSDGKYRIEVVGKVVARATTAEIAYRVSKGYADPKPFNAFKVYLFADDGTKIEAFLNAAPNELPEFTSDCHGRTFVDGKFWINNDQVEKILSGDGYREVTDPREGDVVIYRNSEGDPIHSMTVVNFEGLNETMVTGQAGTNPTVYYAPLEYGTSGLPYASHQVYRR